MGQLVYLFTGRVTPERAQIDVNEIKFKILESEDCKEGELFIEIIKSQISARFVTSETTNNIHTLRNIVEDAVRVIVDIMGYYLGYGYDVDIVQASNSSNSDKWVFGIDIPALKNLTENAGINLNDIFKLSSRLEVMSYFRRALSDVREAIKSPNDTGFFCYRSIESLMNYCASIGSIDSKKEPIKAWELFRNTYSISKDEIMFIKGYADPIRHGNNGKQISDQNRADIFVKTWSIINQFILKEKT